MLIYNITGNTVDDWQCFDEIQLFIGLYHWRDFLNL